MFDIGFWELTLVAVIALIVLGPERLPVVARTMGKWVGRARSYTRGLTREVEREVNLDDVRRDMDDIRRNVQSSADDIESDTRATLKEAQSAVDGDEQQSAPESAGLDEASVDEAYDDYLDKLPRQDEAPAQEGSSSEEAVTDAETEQDSSYQS